MNYGPNSEWEKNRNSTAPTEGGSGNLEKRVAGCLVGTLVVLGFLLVKACDAESDDKSIEPVGYEQAVYLDAYQEPEPLTSLPDEQSPAHIPLDFIVEFAPPQVALSE